MILALILCRHRTTVLLVDSHRMNELCGMLIRQRLANSIDMSRIIREGIAICEEDQSVMDVYCFSGITTALIPILIFLFF